MLVSLIFLLVSTVLLFVVGGTHGHMQRGRHQELAQRARGDVGIHKRAFNNARFTFYDVGLGACGQHSSPGDFAVALNVAQYGQGHPGPQCFKSITISYGGKTAQATIMDECTGCPYGGLDFSTGLFSYFASENDDVLYGSWWFNEGTSEPTPSMSSEWMPTPRADWSAPTSTVHYHHYAADTVSATSTLSTSETSTTSTSETPTTSLTDTSTTSTSETPTTSLTDTSTTSTSETPTTSLTGTSTTSTTETSTTSTSETPTTSLTGTSTTSTTETSTTSTHSSLSATPYMTA
ncbi:hypothetical protein EDB19DRAFT_83708 [Suillus lakei]|nr:hypothetical protein EDB19DRAFT_83708 [Suillus lakei]